MFEALGGVSRVPHAFDECVYVCLYCSWCAFEELISDAIRPWGFVVGHVFQCVSEDGVRAYEAPRV